MRWENDSCWSLKHFLFHRTLIEYEEASTVGLFRLKDLLVYFSPGVAGHFPCHSSCR